VTPGQVRFVGVLSAISTVLVLVGGLGSSGADDLVNAALRKQPTATAPLPAASDSPATGDELSEENFDGGGGESVAETPPVDDSAVAAEDAEASDEAASDEDATPTEPAPRPTQVRHVFVIVLAGHGFDAAFGEQSTAPYLAKELRPQGTLLTDYRPLGSADLPDHLALISGQPPNADTRAGCPTYKDPGCVYKNTVTTIADQLSSSRRSWRAYVEDLDKGPADKVACRRPDSNAVDDTFEARPGDGYATRHNPFVYFHSLLDLGGCDASDGPLSPLEADLGTVETTPSYSYIVPNLCNDGTESPCADGTAGGLPAADAFLAQWVPKILASPAYTEDGLLIVTFAGGAEETPNGTLLVSRFVQAGGEDTDEHNPYTLLRSVQDLFALKPLGRAAKASSLLDGVLAGARLAQPGDD